MAPRVMHSPPDESRFSGWYRNRELYLLIALLLYIGLAPFVRGYIQLHLLNNIAFMLILLSGTFAVSQTRRQTVIAMVLALPTAFLLFYARWYGHPAVEYTALTFTLLFIGYTIVVIVRFIFDQTRIDRETICAAVSAYLLLGVFWSIVYALMEQASPGSFTLPSVDGEITTYNFMYFSFTTLTTLGYGDILPNAETARSLTNLEAILGQLYLAVIIARLVGMQISQGEHRPD